MSDTNKQTENESGVAVEERVKTQKPSLYKVILLNDDYTPMDFVIYILKTFFHKNEQEAQRIMMQVHNDGKGLAGIYPYDIAETKVAQVTMQAQKNQYPLKCILEKDS